MWVLHSLKSYLPLLRIFWRVTGDQACPMYCFLCWEVSGLSLVFSRLGAIFWLCIWSWKRGNGHFTNPRTVKLHGCSVFLQNWVLFCPTWKSLPGIFVSLQSQKAKSRGMGQICIGWVRGLNTESLELRGGSLSTSYWAHVSTFLPHLEGCQK